MNLDTLFEKFELLADAPDAVAKIRAFVMWSAFSGALSNAERTQCVPESWAEEESPILPAIPSSWEWRQGHEVFQVIRGVSYTKTDVADIPFDDSVPVLRANNIGSTINFDDLVHVPRKNVRDEQYLRRGDILIAMSSGSKKLVGKAASIDTDFSGAFGAFCAVIRNKSSDTNQVLARYFQSPQYTSWVTAAGRGIGINNLGKRDLESLPIPMPPLAEQKRIVAKVDELMALCDRLEAQQQERKTRHAALARAALTRFADAPTPANLEFIFHKSYDITPVDLRKTILTLAVTGKLIGFESETDVHTVGDHVEFQNGYAFKSEWFKPDGVRVCRNVNVSHGVIDWRESAFVDSDIAKEFERFALEEGNIVLSLDRPLITTGLKVARVRKSDLPCLLLQRVAKPVPKHDQLDLSYFFLWLNSPEFVDSIDPGRSNGVPHISTRQVQRLPFVLPSMTEQRQIVAKVERLMALVDALETQLSASQATAENLLSTLVEELSTQT